jgi:hypothetical protein
LTAKSCKKTVNKSKKVKIRNSPQLFPNWHRKSNFNQASESRKMPADNLLDRRLVKVSLSLSLCVSMKRVAAVECGKMGI